MLFLVPHKGTHLGSLMVWLNFPISMPRSRFGSPYYRDSSRANFGSIFAYVYVIEVSAISFYNVSLTSIEAATKAIL
jgi:hypothetical protein